RLHGTVGVDPAVEFVAAEVDEPASDGRRPWRVFPFDGSYEQLLEYVLAALPFRSPWSDRPERIRRAAAVLRREIGEEGRWSGGRLEVLDHTFFRNKGAYVVGRVVRDGEVAPLI